MLSFINNCNRMINKSSFKLKVLLKGTPDAAKDNLFQKFIKSRFERDYKLTVGVDILIMDVEYEKGEIATLSIWDLGSQKRYEFMQNRFYKGAVAVLLIFDLSREETYTEAINWLTEIKQFAGSIPFILIGNNVDLVESKDKTRIQKEAREFAKNEGGFYIETSPTKIDIVEDTIRLLTRKIIEIRY